MASDRTPGPAGKRYSGAQKSGDAGIALVDRLVTGLGCIWHHRSRDVGIDGEIELVDPTTSRALNRLVLAQVKSTSTGFPGDGPAGFHFICDRNDLGYWRQSNLPVILICVDLRTDEVWWANVDRAAAVGERGNGRIDFDRERDRLGTGTLEDLLALGRGTSPAPADTGRSADPEALASNLLPIKKMPPLVYVGDSIHGDPRDLISAMRQRGVHNSDWVLRAGRLYSFSPLKETAYADFVDAVEGIETSYFALSKDLDTKYVFMDLLRQTVLELRHRDLRYRSRRPSYVFFRAPSDLSDRKVKVGNGTGRTVFTTKFKDDGETISYCRHEAAELHFTRLGGEWSAVINPTWHFTFDGFREQPWGGERVAKLKRFEKNDAVRGRTQFWASYLTEGSGASLFDDEHPLRFGELLSVQVDVGIDDASWRVPTSPDPAVPTLWEVQDS